MSKLYVVYYMVNYTYLPVIHGIYDNKKLAEKVRIVCMNFKDCDGAHSYIEEKNLNSEYEDPDKDYESYDSSEGS